jgi:hypothetical protein
MYSDNFLSSRAAIRMSAVSRVSLTRMGGKVLMHFSAAMMDDSLWALNAVAVMLDRVRAAIRLEYRRRLAELESGL